MFSITQVNDNNLQEALALVYLKCYTYL